MATKEETFEQLIELQHLMGAAHHQHMMQHGPMADATRGKGRVLALLKMKDGLATKDMANVLGIRVSSLNETLSRLEADGIVERKPSEQDGRVMLVYLTEKGRAEEQPQNDLPEMLFVDFQEAELDTLKGYLRRMSTALEERLGADWREQMHHMRRTRSRHGKARHAWAWRRRSSAHGCPLSSGSCIWHQLRTVRSQLPRLYAHSLRTPDGLSPQWKEQ